MYNFKKNSIFFIIIEFNKNLEPKKNILINISELVLDSKYS